MLGTSDEQAQGYHDFYENVPGPFNRGTPEHQRWCSGWVLAAIESGSLPKAPKDYDAELHLGGLAPPRVDSKA